MSAQIRSRLDPRRGIVLVLVAALVAQIGIAVQGFRSNPLATVPLNDAKEYWDWGGRIARGVLVGDTPFMSAPLYPYVVGAVRALGGGLAAVVAVQIALHLATAWLVFRIASTLFSERVGLVAAVLWCLFLDPSAMVARVLNCSLQTATGAWAWERALAAHARFDARRCAWLGLALGLAVVANPVLVPLVPLSAVWLAWNHRGALRRALLPAAIAVLCIAPATLHNWLASRELILTSAQAGLGFYHGNQPGAHGIYHAAEGVSSDRVKQTADARDAVRGESDGTWKGVSDAYMRRGLAFWRADPSTAVVLALEKAWWFAGGRNYGDVYASTLERDDGLAPSQWLASLPVAWFTIPALFAALLLMRRGAQHWPGIALLGATFATVVVFWYSPRYRLPCVPVIAVFGAWTLVNVLARREPVSKALRVACGLAFAASIAATWTLGVERDAPRAFEAQFHQTVGNAHVERGEFELALDRYARAARLGFADAAPARADVLRRMGRAGDAIATLRATLARSPEDDFARRGLAIALAQSGDLEGARAEFERLLAHSPDDAEAHSGLGNVLFSLGRVENAIRSYEHALTLDEHFAAARFNLGRALEARGDAKRAEDEIRRALRDDETLVQARAALADLLITRGAHAEARRELEKARGAAPQDETLALALAWLLATAPDAAARDGVQAVEIARTLVDGRDAPHPQALDTLAAALAEAGRFDEARAMQERALAIVRREGPAEIVGELEERLARYTRRETFRAR